jgi:predicted MFS family arabinose efflux permease
MNPRHKNYKWYVVAMLWWIAFFNYADRQAVFSVFPLLSREFQLSNLQLGLLGSSFAWVYGLSAPLVGNMVDRVRRKSAILSGLQIWSFICMATALSRNFVHLLFFRATTMASSPVRAPWERIRPACTSAPSPAAFSPV